MLHECENFTLRDHYSSWEAIGSCGVIGLFHCWPCFTLKSNLHFYEQSISSLSRNLIELHHIGYRECHIISLTRKNFHLTF